MEIVLTSKHIGAADARPYLLQAAQFDTSAGLLTPDEAASCAVWQAVEHAGQQVGAYGLSLSQHERGTVLWVVACAAAVPGQDLTPHLLSIIEQQAQQVGAAQVAMTTIRRGAVKKLLQHGYEISGITLRKRI